MDGHIPTCGECGKSTFIFHIFLSDTFFKNPCMKVRICTEMKVELLSIKKTRGKRERITFLKNPWMEVRICTELKVELLSIKQTRGKRERDLALTPPPKKKNTTRFIFILVTLPPSEKQTWHKPSGYILQLIQAWLIL